MDKTIRILWLLTVAFIILAGAFAHFNSMSMMFSCLMVAVLSMFSMLAVIEGSDGV